MEACLKSFFKILYIFWNMKLSQLRGQIISHNSSFLWYLTLYYKYTCCNRATASYDKLAFLMRLLCCILIYFLETKMNPRVYKCCKMKYELISCTLLDSISNRKAYMRLIYIISIYSHVRTQSNQAMYFKSLYIVSLELSNKCTTQTSLNNVKVEPCLYNQDFLLNCLCNRLKERIK